MREDDSEIRYYMPVVRRLIILAAVIIAVPVVMWTITGFVRTYIGPVRPPTIQTMAVLPVPAPEQTATIPANNPPAPAPTDTKSAELPPMPAMNAAANVPSGSQNSAAPTIAMAPSVPHVAPPAPAPVPTTSNKMTMSAPATAPLPVSPAPAPANLAPPPAISAPAAASLAPSAAPLSPDRVSNSVWPDPPAALASASPVEPVADAVPASEPIAGPVPLPRKRPHSFAVAQASIPTPRPRPAPTAATQNTAYAVTPVAADAPSSPFDWLRRLFQPSSPAAAAGPQEDLSGAH
jgi:hypothetical protein